MDKPTLNKLGLRTRDYLRRESELKRAVRLAKTPEKREKAQAQLDELHARYEHELDEHRRRVLAKVPPGFVRNPQMVCPHCQAKGDVSTSRTKVKQGISGAKATGALLTGGLSVVATGLSRKQKLTQARCGNCGAEWLF